MCAGRARGERCTRGIARELYHTLFSCCLFSLGVVIWRCSSIGNVPWNQQCQNNIPDSQTFIGRHHYVLSIIPLMNKVEGTFGLGLSTSSSYI